VDDYIYIYYIHIYIHICIYIYVYIYIYTQVFGLSTKFPSMDPMLIKNLWLFIVGHSSHGVRQGVRPDHPQT
jgi:hypothetical protein